MLRRWPSHLERSIDRQFAHVTAGLIHGEFCENPVTGSLFVFGVDPIDVQKEQALRAQRARCLFQTTNPGDLPRPPVDAREWSSIAYDSPADWLVAQYARSCSLNDYDPDHPDLATYAGGLRASGLVTTSPRVADFIRAGVERLLERFPPKPLHGLDEWLVWRKQPPPDH
jgi:hypothetical protein